MGKVRMSEFAFFKEMESVIQQNGDFPDTFSNLGFYAYLAANEAADPVMAKKLYLKSAQYYLPFLNTFTDDNKAFYGIALAYWHAIQLSEEPAT